ncbi:MAG: PadR family transcriptional regulator [Symbiobacterium thermophilum]|uniref:PadR family transcriptional regulator n=1 Tax=Symbiobacterium thermophilum TaxID=2734 RepID=A0A953IAM7_SYMTR|nr:PadR family transcriptional regulator [Symbiobacterium thermophilum]
MPVVRLVILGLLNQRPMSGYEIQQLLQVSRIDQWSDILPGSIYHALKKMAAEGLVALAGTEQTGMRTKAIFEITDAGRAEYRRVLREAWSQVPRSLPGDFYLLLSFAHDMPRADLLAALRELIARLEERLAQWEEGRAAKAAAVGDLPPPIRAAFDNGREHMEADLRFLRRLLEEFAESE